MAEGHTHTRIKLINIDVIDTKVYFGDRLRDVLTWSYIFEKKTSPFVKLDIVPITDKNKS